MPDPDYTLNRCEGPLMYMFDEASGIYFLNNPIALMFAANIGLPGATRDFDYVLAMAHKLDVVALSDDAEDSDPEYLDAAKKVVDAMAHRRP